MKPVAGLPNPLKPPDGTLGLDAADESPDCDSEVVCGVGFPNMPVNVDELALNVAVPKFMNGDLNVWDDLIASFPPFVFEVFGLDDSISSSESPVINNDS